MKKIGWFRIPPWIILGSVIILTPILVFWTRENLSMEKRFITDLLVEKGSALIRSFEAGTRTGMMGMMGMMGMSGGGFRLQALLTETARQPGIAYIIVTDPEGTILADNNPDKIGGFHGKGLDLKRVSRSKKVEWREIRNPDGPRIFEVFRRFQPTGGPFRGYRWGMTMPGRSHQMGIHGNRMRAGPGDIIFVGLDMKPIEAARRGDAVHSVIMALILLLIGFVCIFLLFLTQAYRTARASLTRVKAFSDNVVEHMPMGLLLIDADGKIVSFNQTAESVMKLSSGEVLGRDAGEVLPRQMGSLVEQCKSSQQIIEREIDCPLEGGESVPMDISVSSLEGDDGTFLGTIVLFRDLTEIQDLKNEIERNRRLASLGKLAAGVAHEIRNPLSSIKGFATYFKERYRDNPEDQETANIMIQEVERLNRVISQLMEFARPVRVEKRPADLDELMQQSLKMVEGDALQKRIRLELLGVPSGIEADMDPDRMKQVLLNLYINALEAMEKGGTLTVEISQDESSTIRIAVSDTGSGIKREDLAHVFDPYFTTKSSGTGLGLAIAHKIIESLGGEIHMESNYGKGTRVTLLMPV